MPVEMGLWRVDDKPVRLLPETGTVAITRNRPSSPWRPSRRHQPGPPSIVSAHMASQIVSIVTVLAADQPAAVALAIVSDALKRPVASSTR